MKFEDLRIHITENCYGGKQTNTITWDNGKETISEDITDFDSVEYSIVIGNTKTGESLEVIQDKWIDLDEFIVKVDEYCKQFNTTTELVTKMKEWSEEQ